jgi:type II secretory pathway predicted ATPase ExeA
MAHAQISGQCTDVVKDLKVPVDRAISVQKAMQKTLNSDQLVDRYNRHVNILVGNLDREASRMQRLLAVANQRGCDKLVQMMQDHIVKTKNIYNEMMASILLPAPKKPLAEQNEKLESELESLMKIH